MKGGWCSHFLYDKLHFYINHEMEVKNDPYRGFYGKNRVHRIKVSLDFY